MATVGLKSPYQIFIGEDLVWLPTDCCQVASQIREHCNPQGLKSVSGFYPLVLSRYWDSNGKKLLLKSALSQNVCTYKEMMYQTVMIPGCPRHTVPYYSYPVAVSCKCGKCNTDYSDCVHEKWNKDFLTCECQVLLDIMDHLNDTRSLAELLPIVY
ncbi:Tshb [Columba livia]|nr:Tshb [Columba livia]